MPMIRPLFCLLLFLLATIVPAADPALIAAAALERAKQEFQEGKFAEALATLDELEKKGEPSGRSMDLRGRIRMEQGQFDEAARLFEAAHEKNPASLARLHLGDLLLRQKKFAEAREAYRSATKATNILAVFERLRFGVLLTYLGEKDDAGAQHALAQIKFPSESGAYYYGQAAWSYAQGQKRDAEKWVKRAEEIYGTKLTTWFARWLYEFGWTKTKPTLSGDP